VGIASRYRRFDGDLLDLVGVGHLGLHRAIERFDLDRFQTRLSTYASGWITFFIQDYIRRNSGPVRLPATSAHRQLTQNNLQLLAEARKKCERDEVEPTERALCERISRYIDLDPDDIAFTLRLLQGNSISLHQAGKNSDGPRGLEYALVDEAVGSEDATIMRLDQAKVRKRIQELGDAILGKRERVVFFSRCLSGTDEVTPLHELAAHFNVSVQRIHQLETSSKRKIITALAHDGYVRVLIDGRELRLTPTSTNHPCSLPLVPMPDDIEVSFAAG
jgi:RNA polymerase sigma-32 factor